jgi:hypothetical protein
MMLPVVFLLFEQWTSRDTVFALPSTDKGGLACNASHGLKQVIKIASF